MPMTFLTACCNINNWFYTQNHKITKFGLNFKNLIARLWLFPCFWNAFISCNNNTLSIWLHFVQIFVSLISLVGPLILDTGTYTLLLKIRRFRDNSFGNVTICFWELKLRTLHVRRGGADCAAHLGLALIERRGLMGVLAATALGRHLESSRRPGTPLPWGQIIK